MTGIPLGAAAGGADMLQQVLEQKAREAFAIRDQQLREQQLAQQAAYQQAMLRAQEETRAAALAQTQQKQQAANAAAETAGNQAQLRAAIQGSQNVAGTNDPNGALATRNALRVALASSGAKATEIPQEPKAEAPKLHAVTVPGPNGQPLHKLVTEDEMKAGVVGYKAPAAINNIGGGNGALTDEGVDYAATQYRVTGIMPPMGMGNAQARAAIINKAAEQARTIGQTPVAAIQKQAAFKADATALSQIRKMHSSAQAYESKASQQADLVRSLSGSVPRSQYPLLNQAIVTGKVQTGDPDAQAFVNAVVTFSTEYAKIMEGSTSSAQGSSDASRRTAEKLIRASLTPQQLEKVLGLMQQEMKYTLDGYGATEDEITRRMVGAPTAPPTSTETPEQRLKRLLGGG